MNFKCMLTTVLGFTSFCSCCALKTPSPYGSLSEKAHNDCNHLSNTATTAAAVMVSSLNSINSADLRSTSVAELRRKAQEHSAALLHLHAAAAAGLSFSGLHFPPLSFQQSLNLNSAKSEQTTFPPPIGEGSVFKEHSNKTTEN